MAIVAVDIDGVIASKLESGNYPADYVKKQPIPLAVEALRDLKANGHYVKLYTARFPADREVTLKWLFDNGFHGLFDKLVMGKEQYDILIDDRALRFNNWMDTLKDVEDLEKKGQWY